MKQTTDAERRAKQSYYQRNKEAVKERARKRRIEIENRRKALLSQFNCIACDNNNPDLIQWHHLEPANKKHTVYSSSSNEEVFWNEVLKCVPLCANCHVLIHKNKLCLIPQR